MKICHVAPQVFRIDDKLGYGGAEQVIVDIAEPQAEMGHEVTVVAPKGSKIKGCNIIETIEPKSAWGREEEDSFVFYHHKLERFDIVLDHSHHYLPFLPPTKAICHLCHGLQTAVLPQAHNMITLSEFHREVTLGGFQKDSKVVRHGIDLVNKYKPNYDKKDYFVCASIMLEHKNHLSAIGACVDAGVHLKVIGEHEFGCNPDYVNRVKGFCEEHGFDFIGRVTHEEKVKYLGEAKAVLLPFTMPEATSLLLMESNACGTPVIASRIGGIPEILEDGTNGYRITGLKDLTERIEHINKIDGRSYLKFTYQCRAYAEDNFDRKRMAQDYLDLFEKAIKGERW